MTAIPHRVDLGSGVYAELEDGLVSLVDEEGNGIALDPKQYSKLKEWVESWWPV